MVVGLSAPPALADDGPAGSAYGLSVRTTLLDAPLVKIDPLPAAAFPKGGEKSLVEVGPNLAGLVTAKVLNASSEVADGVLTSAASIAEVEVDGILSAKVVNAECVAGEDGPTGSSSIAELTVLGQKIDVSAKADIDVLGVATVKIDEQIKDGDTLTVNAVHVTIGGTVKGVTSADIVLSQAKCSAGAAGTEPTEPIEPTSEPEPSEPGQPSTTPSAPDVTSTATTTSSAGGVGDIEEAANTGDLAETGVSAVVPMVIGGLLLVAGGVGAVVFTRRRRATTVDGPTED